MPVMNGLEGSFDTVSSTYEKLRPGYVDVLYQKLFDYCPIDQSSIAVEIGIGGGQATLPVLQTGCRLTAVEYGPNLADLCRNKFKDYPNFSIVTGKFEEVHLEEDAYDLVFSASAFHWIPEEIGYSKVFSMLKSGGTFARFANHPFRSIKNPELTEEIDAAYRRYYYPFHNLTPSTPKAYTEGEAEYRAKIAERYGFTDIQYAMFYRTRTFSAEEYIQLLGTYSDHIAIDEPIRTKFFSEIRDSIKRHGGTLDIYDTIDLQLVRKP